MSDLMARIHDDIEEYVSLCEVYGEKPECDEQGANPYCDHARKLRDRSHAEWLAKEKEAKNGVA